MDKVRVGMIGAGWVSTARHLPALSALKEVEITNIWSRSEVKVRKVADEFGIATVTPTWETIVESSDVDAVIIATPPVLHCTITVAALRAGKHVLCQGRMARNLREALEMYNAAQGAGRVACLYPPRPGLKGDRVMRRLLADGTFVGDVFEVRVTSLSSTPKAGYAWTEDPEVCGINVMALGMWAEVLNRWVGLATRVQASAKTHNTHRQTPAGEAVPAAVPDSLAIVAELKNGATASYHFSNSASFGPGHSIEIYGSRGAVVYKLFAEEVWGASNGAEKLCQIPIAPEEERAHSTDSEFIEAIRSGGTVSPSFDEGLRYMEFCEAVALSAKIGQAVAVPPEPAMYSWDRLLEKSAGRE